MITIAFDLQHFTIRGTETAVYKYAEYNEILLKNSSLIVYNKVAINHQETCADILNKFKSRFRLFEYETEEDLRHIFKTQNVLFWYELRSGLLTYNSDWKFQNVFRIVHCVFTMNQPYGDIYLPISTSVPARHRNTDGHYVPHIVDNFIGDSDIDTTEKNCKKFRDAYCIPENGVVFGRYGAKDTFDIPFIHDVLTKFTKLNENAFFILVNTETVGQDKSNKQIIFLDPIYDDQKKLEFIDACDFMIHARLSGESFGLSIAEFAARRKPVITWKPVKKTPHHFDFHHKILGDVAYYYSSDTELLQLLNKLYTLRSNKTKEYEERAELTQAKYRQFEPADVMQKFKIEFMTTIWKDIPLFRYFIEPPQNWLVWNPSLTTLQILQGRGYRCQELIGTAGYHFIQESKKKKLYMTCNFASDLEIIKLWTKLFPKEFFNRWQLIETPDLNCYTLIINRPKENTLLQRINAQKTLVFRMEPEIEHHQLWNAFYQRKDQFLHFGDLSKFRNNNEWHLAKDHEQLITQDISKEKLNHKRPIVSAIVSGKYDAPGHRLRIDFLKFLESKKTLPFDLHIYGKENPFQFKNYLGFLPEYQKNDGLFPYKYHFNAENTWLDNYYTEKIIDPLLAECLCFYWGCPNLETHIDTKSFIRLPLNSSFDLSYDILESSILKNEYECRLESIKAEKIKILTWYNLGTRIESLVTFYENFHVIVINLDERKDRLEKWIQETKRIGLIKWTRMNAIDGKTVSPETIKTIFYNPFRQLRIGEIGCALSHLHVIKECAKQNQPMIIFEDDAHPMNNFIDRASLYIHLIREHDPDYFLIFLGWTPDTSKPIPNAKSRGPFVSFADILSSADKQHLFGCHGGGLFAYVLSPKGARFILDIIAKQGITWAFDMFILLCLRGHYHGISLENGPNFYAAQHTWIVASHDPIVCSAVSSPDSNIQNSDYINMILEYWKNECVTKFPKYVLNLEHRRDRLTKFMHENCGTSIQPMPAVDGRLVTQKTICTFFRNTKRLLRQGEIGCAMSHYLLWKHCILLQKPISVFEDDTILSENFDTHLTRVFDTLMKRNPNFYFIYFGNSIDKRSVVQLQQDQKNKGDQELISFRTLLEKCEVPQDSKNTNFGCHGGGTFAYIVSPEGAAFLTNEFETRGVNWSIDFWMLSLFKNVADRVFILKNPIAFSPLFDQSSDFDTDIQNSPFVVMPQVEQP
jgi:GR25 family glycosyltransferase involved in LPS biosynthesis